MSEKIGEFRISNLVPEDYASIISVEISAFSGDKVMGVENIADLYVYDGLRFSLKATVDDSDMVGYMLVHVMAENESRRMLYLADFAVRPEFQRMNVGWQMMRSFMCAMKEERVVTLFDMELVEGSHKMMEKRRDDISKLGWEKLSEHKLSDYHGDQDHAWYHLYALCPKDTDAGSR